MEIDWTQVLEKLKLNVETVIVDIIVIALVLLLADFAVRRLTKVTTRIMDKAQRIDDINRSKSLITSMTVIRSVGRYVIYLVAIGIIINQLGYGTVVTNLVTAAGVGALAISLGAQSIIKDVVAGLFITFEQQYSVGDYVLIAGNEGIVTSIAMRCTYLQSPTGQKVIVPNGQITTVINYSTDNNMAILDFRIANDDDMEKAMDIVSRQAMQYYSDHSAICYDKPNTVTRRLPADGSNLITVYLKASGSNQFTIQNELRSDIIEQFRKQEVELASE